MTQFITSIPDSAMFLLQNYVKIIKNIGVKHNVDYSLGFLFEDKIVKFNNLVNKIIYVALQKNNFTKFEEQSLLENGVKKGKKSFLIIPEKFIISEAIQKHAEYIIRFNQTSDEKLTYKLTPEIKDDNFNKAMLTAHYFMLSDLINGFKKQKIDLFNVKVEIKSK